MFFACATLGSGPIAPDDTSIDASWNMPNVSVSVDEEKRSVVNASMRPSGDHAGCKSAKASAVSGRNAPLSQSTTYKSLKPPFIPENAICLPSGDQVGL